MLQTPKHATGILILQLFALQVSVFFTAGADYIPPAKVDGFVYKNRPFHFNKILIEAFYDPLCPYSRDSWPHLKHALHHYGHRVSLVVHLLPLPYHDNAFVASRALHIVNTLNSSATYPLLEWFFKHQEKFYGGQTQNLSRASITEEIVKSATKVVGSSHYNPIKIGFNDTNTDDQTRVSFKYAALRGVYGTPTFYVNGFLLLDTGAAVNWRKVIDPLIGAKKSVKNEESLRFS